MPIVLSCAALALTLSFVLVYWQTNDVVSASICFLGTLALVPLVTIPILTCREYDFFHPLHLAGLSVFCGTTGRAFYIIFSDSDRHVTYLLDERPLETVLVGAGIIALGMVCLGIGYLALKNVRVPIERFQFAKIQFGSGRLKFFAVLCCVITALVTVDFLNRTGFSGFDSLADISKKRKAEVTSGSAELHIAALGYHKMIGTVLPRATCYFLISLMLIRNNRKLWPYAVVTALFACVMPFLASSRVEIIFLILTILILINSHKRISLPKMAIGTACILAVLVGMMILRQGENWDRNRNLVQSTTDTIFGHRSFCGLTKVAHIYDAIPDQLELKRGKTLVLWTVAPIPRTLWPKKPSISLGYEITREVYDRDIHRGGGTPPGFVGEMVWNFGLIGVPIGCLVLGGVLSVFYNTFQPVIQRNSVLRCLYAGLAIPIGFHLITGEVSRTMIGIISFVGLFVLLSLLFRVPKN